MRVQRRSETVRRGSPPSHENAVLNVALFLMGNWHKIFNFTPTIHTPYNVIFPEDWAADNKLGYRLHSYDLGVTYAGYDQDIIMIIEIGAIGDDSKHNPGHKQQLINDGIAKRFIEEDSPNCRFYRINKEDSLINEYLEKLFFVHHGR